MVKSLQIGWKPALGIMTERIPKTCSLKFSRLLGTGPCQFQGKLRKRHFICQKDNGLAYSFSLMELKNHSIWSRDNLHVPVYKLGGCLTYSDSSLVSNSLGICSSSSYLRYLFWMGLVIKKKKKKVCFPVKRQFVIV